MSEEEKKKTIQENVMAAIDVGKVRMRPKWQFVVKAVLLVLGIILAMLTLLYVFSFIVFVLHESGVWFAPEFGARGIREFLINLPWLLILVALLFIIILEYLVKKYSFGYKKPLLYSALGVIAFVVIGGFILASTPVHQGLFEQAQMNHLPLAGELYRQYGNPPPQGNVTPGVIEEILEDGYSIVTPRNESLTIIVSPKTRYPYGIDFEEGDWIFVIGDRSGNTIDAFGIRELDDHDNDNKLLRLPKHSKGHETEEEHE